MMFGLRTNQNEIEKILLKASSLGINKIDTSPSYINGNSDKLLLRALKNIPINDFKIYSKVGRSYRNELPKNQFYLNKYHIENAIEKIKQNFSDYEIEIIQIHVNDNYKNMLIATKLLAEFVKKNFFKKIGFCNTEDKIINKILSELSFNQKTISCQRRYCLGIIDSERNLGIDYIAYGILNSGSIISQKNSSRIKKSSDKLEILERHNFILKNKLSKISLLCKEYNIRIEDFSILDTFLASFSSFILGPTKLAHIESIERLMEKSYFLKVRECINQFKKEIKLIND